MEPLFSPPLIYKRRTNFSPKITYMQLNNNKNKDTCNSQSPKREIDADIKVVGFGSFWQSGLYLFQIN